MRVTICLLLLLSACSTPAIRCDKHLEAINAPASKIEPAPKTDPTAGAGADVADRSLR
jgi:hypothetical protein